MKTTESIQAFLKSRATGVTFEDVVQQAPTWPEGPAKELLLLVAEQHPACLAEPDEDKRFALYADKLQQLLSGGLADWQGVLRPFLDAFMSREWHTMFVQTLQGLAGFANWRGYREPLEPWQSIGFMRGVCSTLVQHRLLPFEYIEWHRRGFDGDTQMAYMLATALNHGDEAIFTQIQQILQGEAEHGQLSFLHLSAFMMSDRDECGLAIEKLLLAAQRQEGLRKSIVDRLGKASPNIRRRLLLCIAENDLLRFKSVASAVGNSFHQHFWSLLPETEQKNILHRAVALLENPDNPNPSDPVDAFLTLWAQSVYNHDHSLPLTRHLSASADPEMRRVALWHFRYVTIDPTTRHQFYLPFFRDPDKTVALLAENNLDRNSAQAGDGVVDTYIHWLEQMPKAGWSVKNAAWSWQNYTATFQSFAENAMRWAVKTGETCEKLMPFWDKMDNYRRFQMLHCTFPVFYENQYDYYQPGAEKPAFIDHDFTDFETALVQRALSDRTAEPVIAAMWLFERKVPSAPELALLEKLLGGKNDQIRLKALRAIAAQDQGIQKACIERLSAGNEDQRTAALDLLQIWKKDHPDHDFLAKMSEEFSTTGELTIKEQVLLETLSTGHTGIQYTTENGFGLYHPSGRGQTIRPNVHPGAFQELMYGHPNGGLSMSVDQLKAQLLALDQLILAHKGLEYEVVDENGGIHQVMFGAGDYIQRLWPSKRKRYWGVEIAALPFQEVWVKWFEDSGLTPMDLFILHRDYRNCLVLEEKCPKWLQEIVQKYDFPFLRPWFPYHGDAPFQYRTIIEQLLTGLAELHPYPLGASVFVELGELIFQAIPEEKLNEICPVPGDDKANWRSLLRPLFQQLFRAEISDQYTFIPALSDDIFKRIWALLFWQYRSHPDSDLQTCSSAPIYFFHAHRLGLVSADELYFQILNGGYLYAFLTDEQLPNSRQAFREYPFLRAMVEQCKHRILELELQRGDLPSPLSKAATFLLDVRCIDYFVRLLRALGDDVFHQGYIYAFYNDAPKRQVLSQLLRRCFPLSTETFEDFKAALASQQFSEKRLIEVALYAPQWLPWMEQLLDWPGLQQAAWWFHAHANEQMDAQKESETVQYSPISAQSFKDGAVDVAWFQQAYTTLGPKRWAILYDAARYICDNNGHARARLYTDAILGKSKPEDVEVKIKRYRNRDNLVAYGLIPLSQHQRDGELRHRYHFLQAFKLETQEQGATRKDKEGEAIPFAFENLARTAGYEDPIRLVWDMEAEEAKRLMAEVQQLDFDGVQVTLVVDKNGKADLQAYRNGKKMADLPPKIKKDPTLAPLRALRDQLRNQKSRVRRGLEEAMLRGDEFRLNEIIRLMEHPVIQPLLATLALISGPTIGFWENGALLVPGGDRVNLPQGATVRIAHCTELYASNHWSAFQRHLFDHQLVQPFKQVFRELYLPTPEESKAGATVSQRYQGMSIQPNKAMALLRSRGWAVDYSYGFQKVFARENLVAHLDAYANWYDTGAECPEMEDIRFTVRGKQESLRLDQVPDRIFSEVMRDADLVVSVAFAGGVDPEAGFSSMAMRRSLVAETARLFQLDNVTIQEQHVVIKGQLGNYSLHLGSGVVHRMPGGMLSIRAIGTQHRGRIFLPFADEDPRTAEIVSKVLLLAKDSEIKDPTILQQMV